jgi:hypothetical protein
MLRKTILLKRRQARILKHANLRTLRRTTTVAEQGIQGPELSRLRREGLPGDDVFRITKWVSPNPTQCQVTATHRKSGWWKPYYNINEEKLAEERKRNFEYPKHFNPALCTKGRW